MLLYPTARCSGSRRWLQPRRGVALEHRLAQVDSCRVDGSCMGLPSTWQVSPQMGADRGSIASMCHASGCPRASWRGRPPWFVPPGCMTRLVL